MTSKNSRKLVVGMVLSFVLLSALSSCVAAEKNIGGEKVRESASFHGFPILAAGSHVKVPVVFTEKEWKSRLSAEQYKVLRQEATEASCSGAFWNEKREGTYYSAATGQALFLSSTKFESGTGWPSFFQPVSNDAIILRVDNTFGMYRIEVMDSSSGSHLGHVFDDAYDTPSKLRFCINSLSLLFVPSAAPEPDLVKEYRLNYMTNTI